MFPEWIVQEIDQDWMTEYLSQRESSYYTVTLTYVRWLLEKLGGRWFGPRKAWREYIWIFALILEGISYASARIGGVPPISLLSLSSVAYSTQQNASSEFSSPGKESQEPRETQETQMLHANSSKYFQDRGMVVVVIDLKDLDHIAEGVDLITMLRSKYEEVRLDLRR